MYCKKCGTEIDNDSDFCYSCGEKITQKDTSEEELKENSTKSNQEKIDTSDLIIRAIINLFIIGIYIGITILTMYFVSENTLKGNPTDFGFFLIYSSMIVTLFGIIFTLASKKKFKTAIIVIIILSICLIASMTIYKETQSANNNRNETQSPQLFTRDANNGDIQVEAIMNYNNLGVDIIIHPNCDIENLVIKIKQYDKEGNIIETFTKNLGNVKEGVEVTTSISLTDFDFSDIFKLGKTGIEVYNGRVKYFQ